MATKLPKYTLDHNKKKDVWELTNDKTDKVVEQFKTKADATKGGVLEKTIGDGGGSVKIKTVDNKFQEERTYPGSADPKKSPG